MLEINQKDLLTSIIALLLGGFLTHIFNKYKERLTILRYTVWHNKIAFSMEDQVFGSIQVTYNGIQVPILYYSSIHIYNESNRDLDKFILNIVCDDSSKMLITHGANKSS
ncbi:hypothetical protein, partial [Leptospira soteropolitanensis]